jgi:hypothetical protein
VYASLLSECYMHRPSHSSWFDQRNSKYLVSADHQSSTLCSFLHSPDTSPILGPNILLNTLFSNTLSRRSSFNVNDQVLHPYHTTDKITLLYILIFIFLDSKLEDKRLSTGW